MLQSIIIGLSRCQATRMAYMDGRTVGRGRRRRQAASCGRNRRFRRRRGLRGARVHARLGKRTGGLTGKPTAQIVARFWLVIIRPHHSTTHVAAPSCYRPSSIVCRSVCHLVSPAKTDEAIEMRFALRTRVGPRKDLLHTADRFVANTVLCSFTTIQPSHLELYTL